MTQQPRQLIRQGPLEAYVIRRPEVVDLQRVAPLVEGQGACVWLDSARTHPVTGRRSILGWDPWLTMTARGRSLSLHTSSGTRRWQGHPCDALRSVQRRYGARSSRGPGEAAAAFGLFGYLSYEFNQWVERVPTPRQMSPMLPEMVWFGMRLIVVVDHQRGGSWLVSLFDPSLSRGRARGDAAARLERWAAVLDRLAPWCAPREPEQTPALSATCSQAQFERMVIRALKAIRDGEIFQANIAQQFTTRWRGSSLALYDTLRRVNPSPFSCFAAFAFSNGYSGVRT